MTPGRPWLTATVAFTMSKTFSLRTEVFTSPTAALIRCSPSWLTLIAWVITSSKTGRRHDRRLQTPRAQEDSAASFRQLAGSSTDLARHRNSGRRRPHRLLRTWARESLRELSRNLAAL